MKLVPLPGPATSGPDRSPAPATSGADAPSIPTPAEIGFKAARLAAALRAGLPVLPGLVVPVAEARPSLAAAAAAVGTRGIAAGRLEVLGRSIDPALSAELRDAVDALGGRVIVRSSSPLEGDARWAGAFSSVTGAGREDVATAVRSCWASAFAVDPLRRLAECGLPLETLGLAVLIQPEIVPEAGGVAWAGESAVTVEGVRGHPGPLLAGWAEGARDGVLAGLIGAEIVAEAAALADRVHAELGDGVIEWAACEGTVRLLQSMPGAAPAGDSEPGIPMPADGSRVRGRAAVPGTAAGPLVACRPHETGAGDCRGAIVLVDRPVPALAPLLFGARGVIARTGAAGSHLAEVARSLGVPMVVGCRPETVTGPGPAPGAWLATINGGTGEVVLAPA
jgi:phosphoenolpyruvate synthase/pyruvate phosphate dikinase